MASSSPSLEEIISGHGLTRKDLESVCPRDVRHEVALKVEDWKMVGHLFSVPQENLTAIDLENRTEDQRRVALLDTWSNTEGEGASYLKLAHVLNQRRRNDLVKFLCGRILQNRTSSVKDTISDTLSADHDQKDASPLLHYQNSNMDTAASSFPSLEKIISCNGLTHRDLESVCPRDVRHEVALKIVKWKMFGRRLNVPEEKLIAIDHENYTEDQRRVDLLDTWSNREGEGASYLKLAHALHLQGNNYLVEFLCGRILQKRTNSVRDTISDTLPADHDQKGASPLPLCLHSSTSLEKIISHHGLTCKDLESVCPHDVRHEVALKIDKWKIFGIYLNVPMEKLAAINRDNYTEDQRQVALVDTWSNREGEGASYLKLAHALHLQGNNYLVEFLCGRILQKRTSSVRDTISNTLPVDHD